MGLEMRLIPKCRSGRLFVFLDLAIILGLYFVAAAQSRKYDQIWNLTYQ